MQRCEDNVAARLNGNALQPLSDVSVTVTDDRTGLKATLYSDDGITQITQPLITDDNGYYGFYAANGEYTLSFSGLRIATFQRKIVLADPSDNPYASKAELAAGSGASLVTFTQAVAGAVPRSLADELRDTYSASAYRFLTADQIATLASIDATPFLQAAIDALPVGGRMHGSGAAFTVTTLLVKSDVTLSALRLKTKAGNTDYCSPITIDGRTSAKSNIQLLNVFIDGNRANQTNIIGASGEDGGRHGIRALGRVSSLLIDGGGATNCGTDSIELYPAGVTTSDTDPAFRNITIRNFRATGSRRHSLSFDSIDGLAVDNCVFDSPGLDLNSTDVATHGNRGARVGNTLANPVYGSPIDAEGYGVGSCIRNVRINGSSLQGGARSGAIFYDPVAQNAAGFIPRGDIWITNCVLDKGVDASSSGNAIEFTSTAANKALGTLYKNVYLQNNKLNGGLLARAVDSIRVTGGEINVTGTYYAVLDRATGVQLATNPTGTAKTIYADTSSFTEDKSATPFPSNPVLAYSAGTTGTLANVVYTQRENRRNGAFTFFITADWTPSAGGDSVLSLTPTGGATINDPAIVNIINNNTGLLVLAGHNPLSTFVRFTNAGASIVHKLQILVTVNA